MTDSAQPTPERTSPPLQFSLRTLLLVTLGFAVFCALWTAQLGWMPFLLTVVYVLGVGLSYRPTRLATAILALLMLGFMCLVPARRGGREASRPATCKNNLKQIGLAFHNYHDVFGCLPPACVADAQGRAMHSWQVLILPFMEHEAFYDKYDFNEPWDGPNNCLLASQIPAVYQCPATTKQTGKSTVTNYLAVVGPETAWPGAEPAKLKDFQDGTAHTICLVEVANSSIHWMEPRDLDFATLVPFVNSRQPPGISSAHPGGANVAVADGSVRFLSDDITPQQLRALLTRSGGEPVEFED